MSEQAITLEAGIREYPQYSVEENAARQTAKSTGEWVVVNAIYGERSENQGLLIDDRFVRLVDGEKGIIDITPSLIDSDIHVSGYFYNPKKGPETLLALKSALQDISNFFNKDVVHVAHPLHPASKDLLIKSGFEIKDEAQGSLQLRISPEINALIENPELATKVKEILNTKT